MIQTRKPGEAFTFVVKNVNSLVNLQMFIKIPNSVYHFRENPRPPGVENSIVPSRNCPNSVFRDKFSSNSVVPPTLMTSRLAFISDLLRQLEGQTRLVPDLSYWKEIDYFIMEKTFVQPTVYLP